MSPPAPGAEGPALAGRRIAVVTTSFPADDDDPSGHFVLTDAIRRAEWASVHVVVPSRRFRLEAEQRDLLTVHRAGGGALFRWPGAVARFRSRPWRLAAGAAYAVGLARHLRSHGPWDQLVAHFLVPTAWPCLAGRAEPLEVVAHGADVRLLLALPRRARSAIIASLLRPRRTVRFVAFRSRTELSRSLSPRVAARLLRQSWVQPLPLGMPSKGQPTNLAGPVRSWLAEGCERPLVAAVGRLIPSKRVDLALAAVAELGPSVRLLVVGDGPSRPSLEQLARGLRVEAHFTGRVPRRTALGLLQACGALIHPSADEAAPTVVREARALGLPVVCCDAGDLRRWAAADRAIRICDAAPAALAAELTAVLGRTKTDQGLASPAASRAC